LKDLREANKQTCLRPEINEKKCFDRSVTDRLNSINGLFATKRLWEGGGAIFATPLPDGGQSPTVPDDCGMKVPEVYANLG